MKSCLKCFSNNIEVVDHRNREIDGDPVLGHIHYICEDCGYNIVLCTHCGRYFKMGNLGLHLFMYHTDFMGKLELIPLVIFASVKIPITIWGWKSELKEV